ncbi:hypothetical protein [Anabaena sp. UHCC 0253]|uniref:hypothetical protein n=1 Tax=Anabaena sp. UHCC 0253 TaxID=2590019 RepID=UPI00144884E4|nr:hypothetical protein [Anabaena sp. UHCC 0253]
MKVELMTKPKSLTIPSQEDVLISPTASTCTWCGKNMMFNNHCKTREEAANCSNYRNR